MSNIWSGQFWKALAERVIATAVGALVAVLTADGFDLVNADWRGILITVGVASGVSFLKGILANVATKDGPGITDAEFVRPDHVNGI